MQLAVPRENTSIISTTTPKGLIAFSAVVITHYINVRLKGAHKDFRAILHLTEFNRIYKDIEDIESGTKGDEAKTDFEQLKETLWRQDVDYGRKMRI